MTARADEPNTLCPICRSATEAAFELRILGDTRASYRRCRSCEFTFAENPTWLARAHSDAVAALDTGVASRNVVFGKILASLYGAVFPSGPYVDWAGGYGLLVRLLRDAGFDAYWQDEYAENLFARGFDWTGGAAEVVSAIEVLEHSPDPVGLVNDALTSTSAGSFVFSQELHPGSVAPDWHYLVPETGQHVSFFSKRTLQALANRLDMRLLSHQTVHLLTREPISAKRFERAIAHAGLGSRLARRGRTPLTVADQQEVRSWQARMTAN